MRLNTIYRLKFQKIKKFRLLRLKARRPKLTARQVFKIRSGRFSKFLRKRIRYCKLIHFALCLLEDGKKRDGFLSIINLSILRYNQNAIISFFNAFVSTHYQHSVELSRIVFRLFINTLISSTSSICATKNVGFARAYLVSAVLYFCDKAPLLFFPNYTFRLLIPYYLKKKQIEKRKRIKKYKRIAALKKRNKRAKLRFIQKGYRRPHKHRLRGRRRIRRGSRFKRQRFTYFKRRVP